MFLDFLDDFKTIGPVVPDRYYLDNAHTVKVMSKVYCKVQTLARKMLQVIAGSVEHWAGPERSQAAVTYCPSCQMRAAWRDLPHSRRTVTLTLACDRQPSEARLAAVHGTSL